MNADSAIVVLILINFVLLAWAEYYRRQADKLREMNNTLRALLDYRKK